MVIIGPPMRLGARSKRWCILSANGPVPAYEFDSIEAIISAVSIPIDDLALLFALCRGERTFQSADEDRLRSLAGSGKGLPGRDKSRGSRQSTHQDRSPDAFFAAISCAGEGLTRSSQEGLPHIKAIC